MHWKSQNDSIVFSIQLEVGDVTRRGILVTFYQIFDPFGILLLVLVVPKLLIISLCKLNLTWDDAISVEQERIRLTWLKGIYSIDLLELDRCLVPRSGYLSVETHAFSDASSEVYASGAFLRVIYSNHVKS